MAATSQDPLRLVRLLVAELYRDKRLNLKSRMMFSLLSPQEVAVVKEHFGVEYLFQRGKISKVLEQVLEFVTKEPLLTFAGLGLIEDVKFLLEQQSVVNDYPLIEACKYGHLEVVQLLLSRPRITQRVLNSAMAEAAGGGHLEIVQLMRSAGASSFNFALYKACRAGREEVARLLVSWGANDFNQALKCAAHNGKLELCQWLLELGANKTDAALVEAAIRGHLEVVRLLLAQPRSYLGVSPAAAIEAATFHAANLLVLKELLMYLPVDNYQQMMDNAIEKNQLPAVEFLLQYRSPYHPEPFQYDYQKMALLAVTDTASLELLAFVLKLGPVDIEEILREAAIYHRLDMVQYLLQQGAADVNGALEALCRADSFSDSGLELARFLVEEAGATDLNSALVAAAGQGRLKAVQYLVSQGATAVNQALVAAVSSSKGMPVIEYLLDQGANDINGALWASLEFNGVESQLLELFTRRGLLSPDYRELDEQMLIAFRDG